MQQAYTEQINWTFDIRAINLSLLLLYATSPQSAVKITALAQERKLKTENQIIHMPRFFEWSLVVLCASSLLVYLLHSMAAEKYAALYTTLLSKLPFFLGN